MNNLFAVDFFCGGGGMTKGLLQANIKVIAGMDNDIRCKETYEYNNAPAKFIHTDIKEIPLTYLERNLNISRNNDELIFVGCSPCQYWSIINTDKSKSEKSKSLLFEFERFIDYYNPGYVLIENVPGILKRKNESKIDEFVDFLYFKGYSVDYAILNLNNYGVPQNRKRFSLIASRVISNIKLPDADNINKKVSDIIGIQNGFPEIPSGYRDNTPFFHTSCKLSNKNLEKLKNTKKNGGNRLDWANNNELQNPGYKGKDNSFRDVYGRMSWDKPSPTITTKFCSLSNGRFGHPDEDRAISIREGASLQTFPKDYVFKVSSIGQAAKIIGNAVPPEFARRLGEYLNKIRIENGKQS